MNNICGCTVSVISASPTYTEGTSKPANTNTFISTTSDPLGPWFGESTHFQGTNVGNIIIYDYQINCNISCWITSVTIEGAAFANSDTLTFTDGNKQQQIGILTSISGGNTFQSHTLDMSLNSYYSHSFRLIESNTICCWRYRSLINMTMIIGTTPSPTLGNQLIPKTECDCIISTINSSLTYPLYTTQSGFTSQSIDPLAPWYNKSVQFRGTSDTAGGLPLIYDYNITCKKSCWITSINIQGSAFQNSQFFLYNFDKTVVIYTLSVHTQNVFASHTLLMNHSVNEYYDKQFRFVEINDISIWRYRQLIKMTVITEETDAPTTVPSKLPSIDPTITPTLNPSNNPSINPTTIPTKTPTVNPILNPTKTPTINPTLYPTQKITLNPSNNPTLYPSYNPTLTPTLTPTNKPTNDGEIRDDITTEYYLYDNSDENNEYSVSKNNNSIIYYIMSGIGFICLCICIICIIYGMEKKQKKSTKSIDNINNIPHTTTQTNITTNLTNTTNITNIDFAEVGSMSSSVGISPNTNMLGNFAMGNEMMLDDVINQISTPGYINEDVNNTQIISSNINGEIDNEKYYNDNNYIENENNNNEDINGIEMIDMNMNNIITPTGYDNEMIDLDDDEFIINDDDNQLNQQQINGSYTTKGNDKDFKQDNDDDLIVMDITPM